MVHVLWAFLLVCFFNSLTIPSKGCLQVLLALQNVWCTLRFDFTNIWFVWAPELCFLIFQWFFSPPLLFCLSLFLFSLHECANNLVLSLCVPKQCDTSQWLYPVLQIQVDLVDWVQHMWVCSSRTSSRCLPFLSGSMILSSISHSAYAQWAH